MSITDEAQRQPAAAALPAPCWWIDRDDCWEITHHPTREDAEANHADRVRSDYGWALSVTGAFEVYPGQARQEPRRCYTVTCPECGTAQHVQQRFEQCGDGCGHEIKTEQIPDDDPDQTWLFTPAPEASLRQDTP